MPVDDEHVQHLVHQMHARAEEIPIGVDPEALRARAKIRRLPMTDLKLLSVAVGAVALIIAGVVFATGSKPTSARPRQVVTATTTPPTPPTTTPSGVPPTSTPSAPSLGGSQGATGGTIASPPPTAPPVPTTTTTTPPISTTSTTSGGVTGPGGPTAVVTSVTAATTAAGAPAETVAFSVEAPTASFSCDVVIVTNGAGYGTGGTPIITPTVNQSSIDESVLVPISGSSFNGDPSNAKVVCAYQSSP